MTLFRSEKFKPDGDPDKPKVGSILPQDKNLLIEEVDWLPGSKVDQMVQGNIKPDKRGYDAVYFRQHPKRPLVFWVIYCKKLYN